MWEKKVEASAGRERNDIRSFKKAERVKVVCGSKERKNIKRYFTKRELIIRKERSFSSMPLSFLTKHLLKLFTGTASQETGPPSDRFSCIWTSPPQISCRLHKKLTFSLR